MPLECLRKRMPSPDPFVNVVEDGLEDRISDPATQDLERLDQGHARLQQRGQLLIEHEELARGDPTAPGEAQIRQAERAGPLDGEDVKPLFLELPPKPRFVVGDVNAFNDLAAR